ncbi:glycerol-3-phosphate 1-O-acyltransferase PlsY [Pelagibacterium xiamenense]|uniref:glycerol-3-phosphate 1-O-acyltransferase PlsY n=1 Tax=Pelagibacterium xiamenense TaxID=2901140 RepID=UPI001E50CA19|nr:glycerol-3-phosphate 1-O-acyltransferase PlsY [Pelagibacterium xiamenense]MCD7061163.1 glycerol-3-phosphate 1-O-acyltransferase PlsY [Pelagibacterium xiamenense]
MIEYALALILGYLLGSIPFGLVATRLAGLGDVRAIGSGNIGATNVLRTGRRDLAALTLVGDSGKGAVAVLIALWLWGYEPAMVAGVAAFFGHVFPVWLGFKGGKGVATYIGILLALSWPVGLSFCAIWLLVAFLSRYSSLSALTAAALSPVLALIFSGWPLALACLALTAVLYYTHRTNIARLRDGSETRIGGKKEAAS